MRRLVFQVLKGQFGQQFMFTRSLQTSVMKECTNAGPGYRIKSPCVRGHQAPRGDLMSGSGYSAHCPNRASLQPSRTARRTATCNSVPDRGSGKPKRSATFRAFRANRATLSRPHALDGHDRSASVIPPSVGVRPCLCRTTVHGL